MNANSSRTPPCVFTPCPTLSSKVELNLNRENIEREMGDVKGRALYDFQGDEAQGELSFKAGDEIVVFRQVYLAWKSEGFREVAKLMKSIFKKIDLPMRLHPPTHPIHPHTLTYIYCRSFSP